MIAQVSVQVQQRLSSIPRNRAGPRGREMDSRSHNGMDSLHIQEE